MHAVLSRETSDAAFVPQIADASDAAQWGHNVEKRIAAACEALGRQLS